MSSIGGHSFTVPGGITGEPPRIASLSPMSTS
jgi:hypothetical protein